MTRKNIKKIYRVVEKRSSERKYNKKRKNKQRIKQSQHKKKVK